MLKKLKKRRAENRKTINYEANTLWNALRPVLGARDLNHKSTEVQQGIIDYLSRLKSLGFDSWRYDFVKGYPPRYIATYNQALPYYFSVGEYWDANTDKLKSWIEHSQTPIAGKKITLPLLLIFL